MSAAGLEIAGLTAGHGPTRIIEGLDLALTPGARLAVLGRNGAGKSTLLAALAGHATVHGGAVRMAGQGLLPLDPPARARAGLGYVPQHRAVFRSLTVEENLRAGLKDRPRAALAEAYALFPRLRERRASMGGQLSGGEQQMLALARTILGQPRLLLLDEPLEGLAPILCEEVMAALAGLAASGAMTILLVEQRIAPALDFADRVVLLDRGRIVWQGDPQMLRSDPATLARWLGPGAVHDARPAARPLGG